MLLRPAVAQAGRQITDGVLAWREGEELAIAAVFEPRPASTPPAS